MLEAASIFPTATSLSSYVAVECVVQSCILSVEMSLQDEGVCYTWLAVPHYHGYELCRKQITKNRGMIQMSVESSDRIKNSADSLRQTRRLPRCDAS